MEVNYRKNYLSKSTETLLDVYQNNRGKYVDEVYKEVEKILEERNIDFERIDFEEIEIEDKEIMKNKIDYFPMILGIISILFTFFGKNLISDLISGIAIMIAIRILFLFYCISLCNAYKLNKILWIVLVLIFGGWGMIALNFGILFKSSDMTSQLENENEIDTILVPNSEIHFEQEQKNTTLYTNCPACLKDLKGQNRCTECDLEFE